MIRQRPLEVVFLTNFSDFCYRAIPALAQMADDFRMRLTLVHATCNQPPTLEDDAKLASFFPEADSYPNCRRMVMRGHPFDAVRRLHLMDPIDLLVAPATDPLGLPRFWHPSLRARLMRENRLPLWTIDRRTSPVKLRSTPQRVGCWIDFHRGWANHLAFAGSYAAVTGAELHILHALPELVEGMLSWRGDDLSRPLHRNDVVEAITRAAAPWGVARVHVAENDRARTQIRLVEEAALDILFASDPNPALPHWLGPKPRLMNHCVSCPVVHIPVDTEVPVWRLERERRLPFVIAPAKQASTPPRDLPVPAFEAPQPA